MLQKATNFKILKMFFYYFLSFICILLINEFYFFLVEIFWVKVFTSFSLIFLLNLIIFLVFV